MHSNQQCQFFEVYKGAFLSKNSLTESQVGVPPGMMRVTGVAAVIGVMNRNNRIYTKENYLRHIELLQDDIAEGLYGELEHPDGFTINNNNISHKIEAVWFNDATNEVMITLLLLDTEKGKIAQSIINSGGKLRVSSRAMGSVDANKNAVITKLVTFDIVGTPGFAQSELRLSENLQRIGSDDLCESFILLNNNKEEDMSNSNVQKLRQAQQKLAQDGQQQRITQSQGQLDKKTADLIENWVVSELIPSYEAYRSRVAINESLGKSSCSFASFVKMQRELNESYKDSFDSRTLKSGIKVKLSDLESEDVDMLKTLLGTTKNVLAYTSEDHYADSEFLSDYIKEECKKTKEQKYTIDGDKIVSELYVDKKNNKIKIVYSYMNSSFGSSDVYYLTDESRSALLSNMNESEDDLDQDSNYLSMYQSQQQRLRQQQQIRQGQQQRITQSEEDELRESLNRTYRRLLESEDVIEQERLSQKADQIRQQLADLDEDEEPVYQQQTISQRLRQQQQIRQGQQQRITQSDEDELRESLNRTYRRLLESEDVIEQERLQQKVDQIRQQLADLDEDDQMNQTNQLVQCQQKIQQGQQLSDSDIEGLTQEELQELINQQEDLDEAQQQQMRQGQQQLRQGQQQLTQGQQLAQQLQQDEVLTQQQQRVLQKLEQGQQLTQNQQEVLSQMQQTGVITQNQLKVLQNAQQLPESDEDVNESIVSRRTRRNLQSGSSLLESISSRVRRAVGSKN